METVELTLDEIGFLIDRLSTINEKIYRVKNGLADLEQLTKIGIAVEAMEPVEKEHQTVLSILAKLSDKV
ncbi:MAG: hypothetical protein FD181_2675 [Prolixibacteraceae bacterium]|nr:MAG: hypothetical protein FD181_2675 [Prolixibacteraceae bacterium]